MSRSSSSRSSSQYESNETRSNQAAIGDLSEGNIIVNQTGSGGGLFGSRRGSPAVVVSDQGAIEAGTAVALSSLELGENVVNSGFEFAGGALQENTAIAQLAIQASGEARDDALAFGAGALIASQEAFRDAQASVERANARATMEVSAANQRSVAAVQQSADRSLQFAAGAVDRISDSAAASQEYIAMFGAQAVETAVQSTKTESAQALDKIIGLTGDAQKQILLAGGAGLALLLLLKLK